MELLELMELVVIVVIVVVKKSVEELLLELITGSGTE